MGAVAGATGGYSLLVQASALAAANIVGGMTNRSINNQPVLDPGFIFVDAASGAAGGYFARFGTIGYMSFTNGSRNAAAAEVDVLLASDPVPGWLPTLTRPVVTRAIRNEVYHGYLQKRADTVVRSSVKSGSAGLLNFLFEYARKHGRESGSDSSLRKNRDLKVYPTCSVTKDTNDTNYSICGPIFSSN